MPPKKEFLPFMEARELVRALGLKSQAQWRAYCASGKRPSNIPGNPHFSYGTEWAGYGDWLGTGKIGIEIARSSRLAKPANSSVRSA